MTAKTKTLNPEGMTRKERRAVSSKVRKLYGIKGDDGIRVHQAYEYLRQGNAEHAVQLAHTLTEKYPDNAHPWLILGAVALSKREAATSKAFYAKASELAPKNASALAGYGKALVLDAEVFEAVKVFQDAIELGSNDEQMASLFCDLMERMGRHKIAADLIAKMAANCKSGALHFRAGGLYSGGDYFPEAAAEYNAAYNLDPSNQAHVLGKVKADMYTHHYKEVIARGEKFLRDVGGDEIVPMLMNSYRVVGRHQEALALFEAHEFQTPVAYKRATAVKANIAQDLGQYADADEAYQQAILICDEENEIISQAFGAYKLREGDFENGPELYALRQAATNRKAVPYSNSEIAHLESCDRIFLMGEQGVGDQFALIPMAARVLQELGKKDYFYVGEQRIADSLRGNTLNVRHMTREQFHAGNLVGSSSGVVFIGDLCRHLAPLRLHSVGAFGGYLTPCAELVEAFRAKYEAAASGRPIVGIAWRSFGTMSGYLRSVSLRDILARLPENAYVVSLQYGDVDKEIRMARKEFTGMSIVVDDQVDQMTDVACFAAQLAALPRIITIDNTTAHIGGALGHSDVSVLIPTGSECMWYWGLEGDRDPWYGSLKLIRQKIRGDWSPALARL